ncbi:hypothetical protein HMPREF9005_1291 [Actinomyces sp. oral taxon 178 str. F0338]|nr:hypothetical protein HMPREF9005_1291 [Actinomyces sp. oral taxon 178 str. F0338]
MTGRPGSRCRVPGPRLSSTAGPSRCSAWGAPVSGRAAGHRGRRRSLVPVLPTIVGRAAGIGAGNGLSGQANCLPQWVVPYPNAPVPAPMGGSVAHAPASRTDDGGSLPQCAYPARRAPGPAPGASGELLLPLALERASCPSLGAQNGSAAWRAGCESADKNAIIKKAVLPKAARTLVVGAELR